jgi:DNA-binding NarL/FixJ family response regulator
MLYDTSAIHLRTISPEHLDFSRYHAAFAPTRYFGTITDALMAGLRHCPDLALIELSQHLDSFQDDIRAFKDACPKTLIFIIDPHPSHDRAKLALQHSWGSYLPSPVHPAEIIATIVTNVWPHATENKFDNHSTTGTSLPPPLKRSTIQVRDRPLGSLAPLTRKETDVLRLAAKGNNCMRIARIMGISVRTVYVHTRSIYRKLNVHSLVEALARFDALQNAARLSVTV